METTEYPEEIEQAIARVLERKAKATDVFERIAADNSEGVVIGVLALARAEGR